MKSKAGLNHKNARTEEQKRLMAQIESDGVCPFCAEHFKTYHPKPIIKETDYWFVTENMSPYEGTTHHILFVYKPEHVTTVEEISPEAQLNLFSLLSDLTTSLGIEGGSFFMRFGNTEYNGSSVEHLHAHLVSGVKESESTDKIKVKLGWKL
jgi:diadenosine tetraphosphate (Ap4A) HIT family hydrolase